MEHRGRDCYAELFVGNRIAHIAKALGMSVLLAERKDIENDAVRSGRTSFQDTLKTCTILMVTCPLTPLTSSMIGVSELRSMRFDAILINVARGGIVVEEALIEALREKWIAGAATDVFTEEPAQTENSVLVRGGNSVPNLVLSPHVAWYARSSIEKLRATVQANVEAFVRGEPINLVT
jgi:phosphoglycerate dehydrogenase-like enzyme